MYVQEIKTYPLRAKKATQTNSWTDKKTLLHTKCYLIARNVGGRLQLQHEDFEKVQLVW